MVALKTLVAHNPLAVETASNQTSSPIVKPANGPVCGGADAGPNPTYSSQDNSPEARMSRRYPQPIRVGHLVGSDVVTDDRKVLGPVKQVVRTPDGKIKLIVAYSRWFGFNSRLVAVPIEKVGSLGHQVGSIDMPEDEYRSAATWSPGADQPIPDDETILIALAKR
jgi:sporulation protein YlmC with PRC-barrel domain